MDDNNDSPLHLWFRPCPPDNCCPSPPPSSASSHHRQQSDQCAAATPMIDLDAAHALADFAHMVLLQRRDAGRGRRSSASKRAKAGNRRGAAAEASGAGEGIENMAQKHGRHRRQGAQPMAFDLNQTAAPSPSEEQLQSATSRSMNEEEQQQLGGSGAHALSQLPPKAEPPVGVRLPFCRGEARAKQSPLEDEKEAKRLRRAVANRESARQTIRRRKALREEFAQKAVSLSQENKHMLKEKELMVKEYKLLKEINRRLKEKMAERLKHKADNPQPPEHATSVADSPPESFPTPLPGRHAAAPFLQAQRRLPPLVPLAWLPPFQVVDPFNLVKLEPNQQSVNLGCCYDQRAAPAAAWYVPPTAYPAMFHHHQQWSIVYDDRQLIGKERAVEGLAENPGRHSPLLPVDIMGADSSWMLPLAETKAKGKAVKETSQCDRTEPPDTSGKVFPLVVGEVNSSNLEMNPFPLGVRTENNLTHSNQMCLLPMLKKNEVPTPPILTQSAAAWKMQKQNLQGHRAGSDEAVERWQKETQEQFLKKAMDTAAARKRRRELTQLKQRYH